MPNFEPTDEQRQIVNAALTGENVVVEAGAGTGKTSTLRLIAEALPSKSIAYVAFNSAIAQEASASFRSLNNVEARTAHSFAYREIVGRASSKFGQRLNGKRLSGRQIAAILGEDSPLTYRVIEHDKEMERTVKPSTIGYFALRTVERFCQSGDEHIQTRHVPRVEGLDWDAHDLFAKHVAPLAEVIWEDVSDQDGSIFKFDHGHYLKLYQLSRRPLMVQVGGVWTMGRYGEFRKGSSRQHADVILYDEAQDANPVVQAIVADQESQIIVVGDRAQAIYGFTGAVNAMDQFDAPHHLRLTKSFRFGTAIADAANLLLARMSDTDMQISGYDPIPSAVTGFTVPTV